MDTTYVAQLASVTLLAPSADNSQPWTLIWNGNDLAVAFRKTHQEHQIFSEVSHATLFAAGAAIEHLDSALTANRITAEWRWPINPNKGQPYASVVLEGTPMDFRSPENAIQRHTNRFAFHRNPLPANLIREIEQFQEGGSRIVPLFPGQKKSSFIQRVQISSEVRFCTQELHEWLIGSLRFTPEEVSRGDGLDVRTLSLPPGGRQFMRFISNWNRMKLLNRLGVHKFMAISDTSLLSQSPALLCIAGPSDPRSIMDAGRLMTRLWMHLNRNGIAVHPYYVISDQINRLHEGKIAGRLKTRISEVENQTQHLLDLQPSETLHIMLRVGYPKKQPLRSRRLPLEAVFVDNSRQ